MREENNTEIDQDVLSATLAGRLAELVSAIHGEHDPLRRALLARAFKEPLGVEKLFPETELALSAMPREGREGTRAMSGENSGRARASRGVLARNGRAGTRRPLVLFTALGGRIDYAFRQVRPGSATSITMACGLLECVTMT